MHTWPTLSAEFATSLRAAGRPSSTIRLRLYHLRRLAEHVDRGPLELGLDDLNDFLAMPGWSAETKRSYRATIRLFYAWAVATERLNRSPAAALLPVRVDRGQPRPVAEDVLDDAYASADDRGRLLLLLGARVGLRCGEISRVRREDVERLLTGYGLRVLGKGGRERIVPLQDDVALELLRQPPGWLFPGQIEGHLSSGHVTRLLSRLLGGGGGHQLRHRYATRAYRSSGYNLRAVQVLLGHATIATTQIYAAVDDAELRAAVAGV